MAVWLPIGGTGWLLVDLFRSTTEGPTMVELVGVPGMADQPEVRKRAPRRPDKGKKKPSFPWEVFGLHDTSRLELRASELDFDEFRGIGAEVAAYPDVVGSLAVDVSKLPGERVTFSFDAFVSEGLRALRRAGPEATSVVVDLSPAAATDWGLQGGAAEENTVETEIATPFVLEVLKLNIASIERVRSSAEKAWTISGAIAGVLLAVGFTASLQDARGLTQVFGVLAIVAWLVTAALFLDVNAPASGEKLGKLAESKSDAARATSKAFIAEASTTWRDKFEFGMKGVLGSLTYHRQRLFRAIIGAGTAIALTALALTFSILVQPDGSTAGTLFLTDGGTKAVAEACTLVAPDVDSISGIFDDISPEDIINQKSISITVDAGKCNNVETELFLPQSAVAGVASS